MLAENRMEESGPHEDRFREIGVSESAGFYRAMPLLLIAPRHRTTIGQNAGGNAEVRIASCCYLLLDWGVGITVEE